MDVRRIRPLSFAPIAGLDVGHDGGMDTTQFAALVYTAVSAVVVAFQLALAMGAPWGAYAMGGAFPGRYPPPMRVAAVVQAVVIAALALVVLSTAGLAALAIAEAAPWLIWLVVAVMALGVVMNAISRSAGERRIWVPVTLVMVVSSLVVALRS
jgi:cytochrome bd-type quinol oxidase subunit 2